MAISTALATVAVTDLAEAKAFYARFLGRPADLEPMPSLAQWDLASGGVQVVEMPQLSGRSMLTLLVEDFDRTVAEWQADGFELSEVVRGDLSRLTQVVDPAGNVITVAEVVA